MTAKTVAMASVVAVMGSIDPDAYTAGTYTTGWISTKNYQDFMAVVQAGTLGTNATIDAKIEQAQDASGTGAKDVTGAAITQITQAGTDQSDTQAVISVSTGDLDAENLFTHFRLSITVGTATSDAGGIVLGTSGRYGPAAGQDAASVGEVVIL